MLKAQRYTNPNPYAPVPVSNAKAPDAKARLRFNVRNMPVASMIIAGLVGASGIALWAANRKK